MICIFICALALAGFGTAIWRCETSLKKENVQLSFWLMITIIFYVLVSWNGMLRGIFRALDGSKAKCAYITKVMISVITIITGTVNLFYFFFLYVWNFYGWMLYYDNHHFIDFWFTFFMMFVLIFQTLAYLVITIFLVGLAFVFSPYKPYSWFPEKEVVEEVWETEECEQSLIDAEDAADVMISDGPNGPHDVETLALARGDRRRDSGSVDFLKPNLLERIPELPFQDMIKQGEDSNATILESKATGIADTDVVLEHVDMAMGGIVIEPKISESQDVKISLINQQQTMQTLPDSEKRPGVGTIVKNKEGVQVLVLGDGRRLLLDKLGMGELPIKKDEETMMGKAKEVLSKTEVKGKEL
jgi:hypothetical protein